MTEQLTPARLSLLSFATLFVIGTDTFLVAPLLPTLTHAFGVRPAVSGWMVSAYALGYALFALIAGPISDGLDRRRVLLTGLAGFAVATALCGFADGFVTMLLFRFLTGVCAAFVSPQIWASIPVLVPPALIQRTMGFTSAGLAIAQVVGIPIGSFLASASWRVPFWALGILSLLLWAALYRFFPAVHPVPGVRGYGEVLRSRPVVLFLVAYLVFQTGTFTSFAFIGSWLTRDFGLTVTSVGTAMVALGLGSALGSLGGSPVIARLGQSRAYALALACAVVTYAALPFAPTLWAAVALLTVASLLGGALFPLQMAMLQGKITSARGTAASLSNGAMYLGTTIAGVVGGLLFVDFPGFHGVAGLTVVAYLGSVVLFVAAGAFAGTRTRPVSQGLVTAAE